MAGFVTVVASSICRSRTSVCLLMPAASGGRAGLANRFVLKSGRCGRELLPARGEVFLLGVRPAGASLLIMYGVVAVGF